jgi:aspartyl protease family protein
VALNRIIGIAGVCAVLGIAAPLVAPAMLHDVLSPAGVKPPANGRLAAPVPTPLPPLGASNRQLEAPTTGSARTVALRADQYGQFEANAVINGLSLPVVVDTGATMVALSAETARRLGILPPQSAFRVNVSTANGMLTAAPVMLDEVQVGGISIRNVQAVVIPGGVLSVSLLGMTFLSRLQKFEIAGGQLTLRQ